MTNVTDLVIGALLGGVISGLTTWYFSWLYFKKAADQSKMDFAKLQTTNNLVLRWLENKGVGVRVVKDADGNPISLSIDESIHERANATDSQDAVVIRAKPLS
jgi:hypothetical protein